MILSWVKGYKIPFIKEPHQSTVTHEKKFSSEEIKAFEAAISKMLEKGVIVETQPIKGQFLSSYFLVPKPDKTDRFILNLKQLNKFIEAEHFKLEDYRTVSRLLEENSYIATIDLKDAYNSVPVHKAYRKYLRFKFLDKIYEFTCLCFGLSTAPYTFTKIMKPLMHLLRGNGFSSVLYLDDFCLFGTSKKKCAENVSITSELLDFLGFVMNHKKCKLEPSKTGRFLGFIFNSIKMTIELPLEKRYVVGDLIEKFSKMDSCKIRDFAKFLGTLTACCPAIKYS